MPPKSNVGGKKAATNKPPSGGHRVRNDTQTSDRLSNSQSLVSKELETGLKKARQRLLTKRHSAEQARKELAAATFRQLQVMYQEYLEKSAAVRKQQLERLYGLLERQMSIEKDVLSIVRELDHATASTSRELKVVLADRIGNDTDTTSR